jgi:hypothetical protein
VDAPEESAQRGNSVTDAPDVDDDGSSYAVRSVGAPPVAKGGSTSDEVSGG